jgi:hypothetical protein
MTNKERFLAGALFRCGDELSDYFKLVIMESSPAREHYLFRLSPQETWEFEHPLIPYDERYAFDFFSEITEIQGLVCFSKIIGVQEFFEEMLAFDEMHFYDDESDDLE